MLNIENFQNNVGRQNQYIRIFFTLGILYMVSSHFYKLFQRYRLILFGQVTQAKVVGKVDGNISQEKGFKSREDNPSFL